MGTVTSGVWKKAGRIVADGSAFALLANGAIAANLPDDCLRLADYKLSVESTIETAEVVAPGTTSDWPWTSPTNVLTNVMTRFFEGEAKGVDIHTPMCRVTGKLQPTKESTINFEVWLPLGKDAWNGKFVGTADGGSTGSINYWFMTDPIRRGYAVMGHDNGHVSRAVSEQSWAIDPETRGVRQELIVDFAHRAQHLATVVGKELTRAYYAAKPMHAYYIGCSQGGHHGMMEAQRYPEDYDGIIAGAHGGDWIGMLAAEAWAAVAMQEAWKLTDLQLSALHQEVLAACDVEDGLADGLIQNPQVCDFDPSALQCSAAGADVATCLTDAQVQAVRKIYEGPRKSTGEVLAPGFAYGSEPHWDSGGPMGDPTRGSFYDFFRLVLKGDPEFDLRSLDWDSDIDEARARFGEPYDAIDPDLTEFKKVGGKLIYYHGWGDALITPYLSVNYWDSLTDKMGIDSVNDFVRLFMVPGMGHCSGGVSQVDWLTVLEKWVEDGVAPDGTTSDSRVIASGPINRQPATRPLCPYPSVARYEGNGSILSAESFSCSK